MTAGTRRRTVHSAVAAALAALTLVSCSTGGGDTTEGAGTADPTTASSEGSEASRERVSLNVGYIDTSINGVGIIAIANELDLWEKAGIDVNLTPFTNGPTQIQAMQGGQIDVGYIGGGAVWLPASGQATVITPNEASNGDVVIASPESDATEPEDLRGLSVGVPEGGAGELMLSLALDSAGLTEDDIEKVVLDPPSVVSAFVSEQIDAAAIFSPLSNQILESVPEAVVVAQNSDYPDTVFMGGWVASNEAVESMQEELTRFLEVFIEANDFRISDTDTTIEYASAESGVPAEQLQGQAEVSLWMTSDEIAANNEDGTTFAQFESLEEIFVQVGRLEEVVDADTFVNTELFAAAKDNQS